MVLEHDRQDLNIRDGQWEVQQILDFLELDKVKQLHLIEKEEDVQLMDQNDDDGGEGLSNP